MQVGDAEQFPFVVVRRRLSKELSIFQVLSSYSERKRFTRDLCTEILETVSLDIKRDPD